jgi:benzoyl-CoA reductase subunit A
MKLYVGIDLGSTTTKAVVMSDGDVILGKGITNSRSNYDTACAIAKTEAFIDTRFSLFRRQLQDEGGAMLDLDAFLTTLEANFRKQQFLRQLDFLATSALGEADGPRYQAVRRSLRDKLEALFVALSGEADELFRVGGAKRSEFFRDLAGNAYMATAETLADPEGVTYDMLVNIYDKCIIRVENTMLDLAFEGNITPALEGGFADFPRLTGEDRVAIRAATGQVLKTPLEVANSVGTGYGRARLPFPKEQIRSEILCHGLGAHYRTRPPCWTLGARTPRRSRWTVRASSPASR